MACYQLLVVSRLSFFSVPKMPHSLTNFIFSFSRILRKIILWNIPSLALGVAECHLKLEYASIADNFDGRAVDHAVEALKAASK